MCSYFFVACMDGCKTCESPDACLTCQESYYEDRDADDNKLCKGEYCK